MLIDVKSIHSIFVEPPTYDGYLFKLKFRTETGKSLEYKIPIPRSAVDKKKTNHDAVMFVGEFIARKITEAMIPEVSGE